MSTPKHEVKDMLNQLPDDSSYEDIQYHLYVLEKFHRGLSRVETEGGLTNEQAAQRLKKWLTH